MDEQASLNHTKWECKYHVVFIPKCRRRTLYQELRRYLGEVFRRLAEQKESQIEEGHLRPDHVHMMIAIPPKYAVSQVIGYIKGKSAIHLARVYGERKRNFVGQHFWARGFYVSTVGRDREAVIREYIQKAGAGRQAIGSAKSSGDEQPPEGGLQKTCGAASATPQSRFERLTELKPPALPGDTYYTALRITSQSRAHVEAKCAGEVLTWRWRCSSSPTES